MVEVYQRIKVTFEDEVGNFVLSERGFTSCWFLVPRNVKRIGDLSLVLAHEFDLVRTCPDGVDLLLDGCNLLSNQDIHILRDSESISVKCTPKSSLYVWKTPTKRAHDEVESSSSSSSTESESESEPENKKKLEKERRRKEKAQKKKAAKLKAQLKDKKKLEKQKEKEKQQAKVEEEAEEKKKKKKEVTKQQDKQNTSKQALSKKQRLQEDQEDKENIPCQNANKPNIGKRKRVEEKQDEKTSQEKEQDQENNDTQPKRRRRPRRPKRRTAKEDSVPVSVESSQQQQEPPKRTQPQVQPLKLRLPPRSNGHVRFDMEDDKATRCEIDPELAKYGPSAEALEKPTPQPEQTTTRRKKESEEIWKRPYEIVATIIGAEDQESKESNQKKVDRDAFFNSFSGISSPDTITLQLNDVFAYKTLCLCEETWQPIASDWIVAKMIGNTVTEDDEQQEAYRFYTYELDEGEDEKLSWTRTENKSIVAWNIISDVRFLEGPSATGISATKK